MSCQTQYSCPVTIPQGLPGTSITGPAGSNGVAVLENTIAIPYTSTTASDEVLHAYVLPANTCEAGDILEVEGIFQLSASFTGDISLHFGAVELVKHTVTSTDIIQPPISQTLASIALKATIYFKTISAQGYVKEVEILSNPVVKLKSYVLTSAVYTDSDVTIDGACAATTGTATLLPLVVKLNKII